MIRSSANGSRSQPAEGQGSEEVSGTDPWSNHPLFAEVEPGVCQQLSAECPIEEELDGRRLIRAGDPVSSLLLLFEGRVAAYKRNADGREMLSRLVEGPSIFGDLELLHGLRAMHDLEVVDYAQVARIPAGAYRMLLERCDGLMRAQLQHLAAQACLGSRNEALIFASLEQRIANVLLVYAQHYGRPAKNGGILVERQLSLKTIARSVGGVWRSVGHALSALRSKGVLSKQDDLLAIEQPAALRDLALPVRGGLSYRMGMSIVASRPGGRPPSGEIEIAKGPDCYEGQQIIVEKELLVGRTPPVDLLIPDVKVCPRHCRVFRSPTGGRFWIQDLDSEDGTLVNGEPVRRAVLHDGDIISVGNTELVFRLAQMGDEDALGAGELLFA